MSSDEARDVLNVSVDQMLAAVAEYRRRGLTAEQAALIEWAFHYCCDAMGRSRGRLAEEMGYDSTNVYKLMMGTYQGSLGNMCEAIATMRERVLNRVSVGFVATPVTEKIEEALEYARTMNGLVVIRGDTGRGKTQTARLWHQRNNHGRTFYCELEERTTYSRFLRALAGAMGMSRVNSCDAYRSDITKRLSRRNTVVIDEAGHLYNPKRPDTAAFDMLRALHDQVHCGLVLIFTLPYWDSIVHGRIAGFLEQCLGRFDYELEIPPGVIFREEVEAIVAAFCPEPSEEMIREAAEVAKGQKGKIRTLVKTLQNAALYAREDGVPMNITHLRDARAWRENGGDWSDLEKA